MRSLLLKTKRLSPLFFILGAMALIGCSDSKYDLNEVDYTIGVGGDGLSIPGSSTAIIQLDDVLELNDEDCVKTLENGDYVFVQEGDEVEAVHPNIDKITVARSHAEDIHLMLDFTAQIEDLKKLLLSSPFGAKATRASVFTYEIDKSDIVYEFVYDGDKPKEVESLKSAGVSAELTFTVIFPQALPYLVEKFDEIKFDLPPYMVLDESNADVKGPSTIVINDIDISKYIDDKNPLELKIKIKSLDFDKAANELGSMVLTDNKVHLEGKVRMSLKGVMDIDRSDLPNVVKIEPSQKIESHIDISTIIINSAKGRFSPEINLKNLGNVKISGIPDFLTDGNVKVDLYNPQIYLTVENNMNVEGLISGTIRSFKGGKEIAKVEVKDLDILPFIADPNAPEKDKEISKICICRTSEGIQEGYKAYPIANLSKIIETIPDEIKFDAEAKANSNRDIEFELGHEYTIKPSYEITAPIAFAENAQIVYNESFDGLAEDLKDIDLEDGTKVEISAKVESRLPIYLGVEVTPVDVNGNDISNEFVIDVNANIAGTKDVNTPAVSDIKIVVNPKNNAALHKLDGFKFAISGTAKSTPEANDAITGVTLNSKKHSLVAKDIVVKLTGKAIVDLN